MPHKLQPTVNDLTFQAATVNGSGSQSANLVLTRAIFSLGIPVAPKNVFPSNIEGLPTWYQLRISPRGYQSRKGDPDVLVALNPTTWRKDVASVHAGGAQLGRGHGRQAAHHLADRGSGRTEDVNAVRAVVVHTESPICRAMTSFKISLVPSPIVRILASR